MSTTELALYLGFLSLACFSYLVNVDKAAFTSLLLLSVIYFPFCFKRKSNSYTIDEWRWIAEAFLSMCTFVAACGILQYFIQFFIHSPWVIDYTPYIPNWLSAGGVYNTAIPVGSYFKSNGFFLLEPSAFSQIMALGLICEWTLFRRTSRLILLLFALAVSYSGTGIFILLLAAIFPLGWKTIGRAIFLLGMGLFGYLLLNPILSLTFTLNRLEEFNSQGTSASDRFIAPFQLLQEQFITNGNLFQMLFGNGPGATTRAIRDYTFFDPTWARLLFEYGLVGSLAFVWFIVLILMRFKSPVEIRAGLFFWWLLMGDGLLTPATPALIFLLVGLWPRTGSTEGLRYRGKKKPLLARRIPVPITEGTPE